MSNPQIDVRKHLGRPRKFGEVVVPATSPSTVVTDTSDTERPQERPNQNRPYKAVGQLLQEAIDILQTRLKPVPWELVNRIAPLIKDCKKRGTLP